MNAIGYFVRRFSWSDSYSPKIISKWETILDAMSSAAIGYHPIRGKVGVWVCGPMSSATLAFIDSVTAIIIAYDNVSRMFWQLRIENSVLPEADNLAAGKLLRVERGVLSYGKSLTGKCRVTEVWPLILDYGVVFENRKVLDFRHVFNRRFRQRDSIWENFIIDDVYVVPQFL
jgi:hypothetical protein